MNNYENTLAISVRGVSHIASGKPVQDYSLAIAGDGFSIAVVCDGHGADKHFRSEIGSKFAAEVSRDMLIQFVALNNDWNTFNKETNKKLDRLKLAIIAGWHEQIEKYTAENPFTADELKKASASFAARKHYDVSQPYGTTILAALVAKDYYLVMMIGDGAIARINSDFSSNIVEFPGKKVYDDQPHSATDSLCSQNSYETIFFAHGQLTEGDAVAFALCSDGMSEAFVSDELLLGKFKNYLNYYAEEGLQKANEAITAQLNQLSQLSVMKDDISLAFATNSLASFDKRKAVVDEPKAAEPLDSSIEEAVEEAVESEEIVE